MPSIEHEAAVELLHRNPQLAAVLLTGAGVQVPADASAVLVDSNLSVPEPTELRADVVTLHEGTTGRLAIVTDIQKDPPDVEKRRAWIAYVALAQVEHKCDAALVVIALRPRTARASSKPIATGHPDFTLIPIVIGPETALPTDGPGGEKVSAELTVLAVLTGALDLSDPDARAFVLQAIADLDAERRETYTRLIRVTASEAVRQALEDLMATVFKDEFVDKLLDKGRADMLLRILAARGFTVPEDLRERVLSCADTAQLEAWGDLAGTAESLEEIFGS